jgi:hypothetical protein
MATARSLGPAIAAAIHDCRMMASAHTDCGAQFVTTQGGWVLANLCGYRKIIVAGSNLEDAKAAAHNRETRFRQHYLPDLPPCRRVLTIDPNGVIDITSARVFP